MCRSKAQGGRRCNGRHATAGRYADPAAQESTDTSYRIDHAAPSPEDGYAPLYDLTLGDLYPRDVYDLRQQRNYGDGDRADLESIRVINRVRGNPDAVVRIYRAVPSGVDQINPGDWVTISRSYAENHRDGVLGGGEILSEDVRVGDLWTEGNSLHEWGWHPGTAK